MIQKTVAVIHSNRAKEGLLIIPSKILTKRHAIILFTLQNTEELRVPQYYHARLLATSQRLCNPIPRKILQLDYSAT